MMAVLLTLVTNITFSQSFEEIKKQIEETERSSEALVRLQVDAYNAKDLDKFLSVYSDSVRVIQYPGKIKYVGKVKMKEQYKKLFELNPKLHCEITNRIVFGNKIIDRERITGYPDNWVYDALVIYTFVDNKISEVAFINQLD